MSCSAQFLVSLLLIATTAALDFKDCGSPAGKITSLEIEGCQDDGPCKVKFGQNVTAIIKFEALKDIESAIESIKAIVGPIVGAIGKRIDICKIVECPIKKGISYTVKYTMIADGGNVTQMESDIQLKVKSTDDQLLFCLQTKGQIVKDTL